MFGTQPKLEKNAIEAMVRAAQALESEAVEQGSVDGFHGAPDAFTASVFPRLWAGCAEYNRLGTAAGLLHAQEETLTGHKQEVENIVIAFRQKYERLIPRAAGRDGGFTWREPATAALLGLAAALGLYIGGIPMAAPHVMAIAAVTAILAINGSSAPRLAAWVRDYAIYWRAASRKRRIERDIDRVRVRILAGMERRYCAEQWVVETEKALASLYRLHRQRGEKAAQLAA